MTQRQDATTGKTCQTTGRTRGWTAGAGLVRGSAGRRPGRTRVARVAAAATAVLAAGAMVTGCGDKDSDASAPHKVSGEAAPATGGSDSSKGSDKGDEGKSDGDGSQGGDSGSKKSSAPSSGSASDGDDGAGSASGPGSGSRCHTGDLRASFGKNHPGAGQENFALVFTNKSGSTCTVRGYPGMEFVDGAGEQVSFDPHRTGDEVRTVTLAPGKSAWAPLSFTNPEMTDVPTVTPSAAKVTPPDEKASLTAPWSGGKVTRTGTASVPKIGPLAPGTGG